MDQRPKSSDPDLVSPDRWQQIKKIFNSALADRQVRVWLVMASVLTVSISSLIPGNARGRAVNKFDLRQQTESSPPVTILLNMDPMGTTADLSQLRSQLKDTFKKRKEWRAYKKGMELRSDLSESERIEKTVFVKAERSIRLDELRRMVELIAAAGATPVLLPITVEQRKARKIDPRRIRFCSVCAIADRGTADGESRPNPLTLIVRLLLPKPDSQENRAELFSLTDLIISDGLPIVLSRSATTQSAAVIAIGKDGEYSTGEKRIQKAQLRTEIASRLGTRPAPEKLVFVKADSGINYGDFEDLYYEAFAAGATAIYLDTGERTVSWADQQIAVIVPAGWQNRNYETGLALDGPDDGSVLIDVVNNSEDIQVDKALQSDLDNSLRRQRAGEIDEARYLVLDGVKGSFTRTNATAQSPIRLRWYGYRTRQGKQQFVSILLQASPNSQVDRQQELMNILQSIRFGTANE